MRRYTYRARDPKTGEVIKGTIQADDEYAAGKLIVDQGFVPDSLKEQSDKKLGRVSTKDRITFSRQFATLIGAGLPLVASLRTVADQTENKAFKSIIEEILASVEGGSTLTDAFAKYPDVFDNTYISLLRAGETGGTLDESLRRLSDQQEKDAAMVSSIRGAMVYPAIILVVIIAVLAFMMISVVPEVEKLYEDMDQPLPGLTLFLVGITAFFGSYWWAIAIVVGILIWAFVYFRKTDGGRKVIDRAKLRMPIFGGLFRKLYNARFARTMQMLIAAGVTMLDAMAISGEATANTVMQAEINEAAGKVRNGVPLSKALEGYEFILPLVPQMAAIGEQSGKTDEMLGRAAQVYTNELDEQINNLSTMIEPILMVVMAGLIGVVIGGTLMPIYSLVSQIG